MSNDSMVRNVKDGETVAEQGIGSTIVSLSSLNDTLAVTFQVERNSSKHDCGYPLLEKSALNSKPNALMKKVWGRFILCYIFPRKKLYTWLLIIGEDSTVFMVLTVTILY